MNCILPYFIFVSLKYIKTFRKNHPKKGFFFATSFLIDMTALILITEGEILNCCQQCPVRILQKQENDR